MLEEQGEKAEIVCQRCKKGVRLWDAMEKRFASESLKRKVEALRQQERANLDSRRLGQMLVHEVSARILSANQKCHEIPGSEDEGVDMVVEFTDSDGCGTGRHMYLQLKAGNSHLKHRKIDGAEIFAIRKQAWVKQWIRQDGPMMLVIGRLSEEVDHSRRSERQTFADVRWMEISQVLKNLSANGKKAVKRIVFKGDRLDAQSVRNWREDVLSDSGARLNMTASRAMPS